MASNRLFKAGDKVVPFQKTVGKPLHKSNIWSRAKESDTPYLVVKYYDNDYQEGALVLNATENDEGGDYFNQEDVIPYQIDENHLFNLLVEGKITDAQYTEWTT